MFDSEIKVKDVVDELKNTEVDIALDIPNKTYVEWLNSLQQLLYSEVIKEQRSYTQSYEMSLPDGGIVMPFGLRSSDEMFETYIQSASIRPKTGESEVRFEDIHTVYADDIQLIKSTIASGMVFPNTFFKQYNEDTNKDELHVRLAKEPSEITVIYFVRPALIEVNGEVIDNSNVMLPIEFIDLAKAKLRGEAYKLANEDGIAAKWLNDYNVLLENFKAWITTKSANFGM